MDIPDEIDIEYNIKAGSRCFQRSSEITVDASAVSEN